MEAAWVRAEGRACLRVGWGVLLGLLLLACAGTPAGPDAGDERADAADGPAPREELEALRREPPPTGLFDEPYVDVATWSLEGPLADAVGATPRHGAGPADAVLAELLEGRSGLLLATEEMYCVSAELGRFWLAHQGHPTHGLRRFLLARCGVPASDLAFGYVHGALPPGREAGGLPDAWRSGITRQFRNLAAGGPGFAGLWFGREGSRGVAMVALARRRVRLDPVPTVLGGEGHVVLRGKVLEDTGEVSGLADDGAWGVSRCRPRAGVALPRFELVCPVSLHEGRAWISLTTVPPGRAFFGHQALEVLVRSADAPASTWKRPPALPVASAESGGFAGAVADALAPLRQEAGLPPLRVAEAQSAVVSDVAPHFFAATLGPGRALVGDLVLRGILAGWEVQGAVREARAASAWVVGSREPGRLLAEVLETPAGRFALLAPGATTLAAGVVGGEDVAVLAGLFATYALLPDSTPAEYARAGEERLAAEREAHGQVAPEPIPLDRNRTAVARGGAP